MNSTQNLINITNNTIESLQKELMDYQLYTASIQTEIHNIERYLLHLDKDILLGEKNTHLHPKEFRNIQKLKSDRNKLILKNTQEIIEVIKKEIISQYELLKKLQSK